MGAVGRCHSAIYFHRRDSLAIAHCWLKSMSSLASMAFTSAQTVLQSQGSYHQLPALQMRNDSTRRNSAIQPFAEAIRRQPLVLWGMLSVLTSFVREDFVINGLATRQTISEDRLDSCICLWWAWIRRELSKQIRCFQRNTWIFIQRLAKLTHAALVRSGWYFPTGCSSSWRLLAKFEEKYIGIVVKVTV